MALLAFASAQQELEQRQLDPAMFGAYQTLLARISIGARQSEDAGRWLDMANSSLKRVATDSEWRAIHAATRASIRNL